MSNPIDTSSLVDRVYSYLLDQIITGSIKYEENISIKDVARKLDVSTMPVREAVRRLEFEQVVTIKPRSSCKVRTPSRTMISEVYELREVLEQYAVTKSSGKVKPDDLARLHGIVDRMAAVRGETDGVARESKAIGLDREFHAALCALAGNTFLSRVYRQLSLHVNMTLIHEKTFRSLEGDWHHVHAEILRCIEQEPGRAGEVLRRHFSSVTALLSRAADGVGESK